MLDLWCSSGPVLTGNLSSSLAEFHTLSPDNAVKVLVQIHATRVASLFRAYLLAALQPAHV
jgi:hypothetical protein